MNLYNSNKYLEDIAYVSGLELPWERLENKTLALSGATGLIGSFLVDVILNKNRQENLNCKIYVLGRNEKNVRTRFNAYSFGEAFSFIKYDVNKPVPFETNDEFDYVLHLASNTHPLQYATDPIGTITTNIVGLQHMLELAKAHSSERFVFASSNEIYGENRGDTEFFDEDYCGYIDSNTMRAGYPESKRCGEALCQAYIYQKDMEIVIPRFTRSYGPTMKLTDSKAISQFIRNGIQGEDIVLKSAGTQLYSYTYAADAVSGLLVILLKGARGEAYNIADAGSDIMLKDLAHIIAEHTGGKAVFEAPDETEEAGFSRATKARLSGDKIKALGWQPKYNIEEGICRTIDILKHTINQDREKMDFERNR